MPSPINMVVRCLTAAIALATLGCAASSGPAPRVEPLVVVASGDTAGWLIPCGCASNQSGGLLRRGSLLEDAARTSQVLYVDVGGAPRGTSAYDRSKFEAILDGELAMGVAAHNLGGPELALGIDYLLELGQRKQVPWVSCNLRDTASGQAVVEPLLLLSRYGRRLAVTGVVSEKFVPGGDSPSRVQIEPPREAILATIAKARGKFDALVVLAYLDEPELERLAADLPEADVMIGGPTGQSLAPRLVGPALLVSATNKGKFIAKLKPPGRSSERWTGEVVELTSRWQDHPQQTALLRKFYSRLEELDLPASETSFATPAIASPEYQLAGTKRCGECHTQALRQWEVSPHAHAWKALTATRANVDSDCQHCHTTGFGLPGGFVSRKRTPQHTNVGCESCHGPASSHARDPSHRTPFAGQAATQCLLCHDPENSPQFDYEAYWKQIAHGRES